MQNQTKHILLFTFLTMLSNLSVASDGLPNDSSVKNKANKPHLATVKNPNTTTGFLQEFTEVRIHTGENRTGKEIYEFRCKACHAKNTQGAPMPDDTFEWSMRIKQKGLKTMLKHAMEGFNNSLMPAKGGCRDCNQDEVYAGVFYMLAQSGIKAKKPD